MTTTKKPTPKTKRQMLEEPGAFDRMVNWVLITVAIVALIIVASPPSCGS